MSIDDKIGIDKDWKEFIPLIGFARCMLNMNYNTGKGFGGYYAKYTAKIVKERTGRILQRHELGMPQQKANILDELKIIFPEKIQKYILYQSFVSCPIIYYLIEKM